MVHGIIGQYDGTARHKQKPKLACPGKEVNQKSQDNRILTNQVAALDSPDKMEGPSENGERCGRTLVFLSLCLKEEISSATHTHRNRLNNERRERGKRGN